MPQSESIANLAAALCDFQYELEGARKGSKNPFFKSSYADLEECIDAIKEQLHKHGLAVAQPTGITENGGSSVVTILMHKSGEWIRGELPLMPVKNDPQAQGSAITYARRYALCAMVGLVQVDDDGNATQQKKTATASSGKGNAGTAPSGSAWNKQREAVYAKGQEALINKYEHAGADLKASGATPKQIYDKLQSQFLEGDDDDRYEPGLDEQFRDAIAGRD